MEFQPFSQPYAQLHTVIYGRTYRGSRSPPGTVMAVITKEDSIYYSSRRLTTQVDLTVITPREPLGGNKALTEDMLLYVLVPYK